LHSLLSFYFTLILRKSSLSIGRHLVEDHHDVLETSEALGRSVDQGSQQLIAELLVIPLVSNISVATAAGPVFW
jgi:hypothetical protein